MNAWLAHFTHRKDVKYIEVSAKTGENIREMFKILLDLSGFPYRMKSNDQDSLLSPLTSRRQLSQRARSPGRKKDTLLAPPTDKTDYVDDDEEHQMDHHHHHGGSVKQRLSRTLSRKAEKDKEKEKEKKEFRESSSDKKFTRHASLMRKSNRMSVKIKQADVDLPDESDCKIS